MTKIGLEHEKSIVYDKLVIMKILKFRKNLSKLKLEGKEVLT